MIHSIPFEVDTEDQNGIRRVIEDLCLQSMISFQAVRPSKGGDFIFFLYGSVKGMNKFMHLWKETGKEMI